MWYNNSSKWLDCDASSKNPLSEDMHKKSIPFRDMGKKKFETYTLHVSYVHDFYVPYIC